jgi:hypothetical protein
MNDFLKEFEQIKSNESINHYLFKNVFHPLPELKAFTDYVEFSKIKGNYRCDTEGLYILHADPQVDDLSSFLGIQDLRKKVKQIYGDEIDSVGVSFILSEFKDGEIPTRTGITKHYDQQDTLHWGCIGTSHWEIWSDDPDQIECEYVIEPGDIIFTRKHTTHHVKTLSSPRGSCILTMHKDGVTEYGRK